MPQAPPGTVHLNIFTPTAKPVTELVAEDASPKVAEPLITDHVPPIAGVALSVAELAQMVWSSPAAAVTPVVFELMITSSTEGEQEPFEIVQRKVFTPTDNPDTEVFGKSALENVPEPEITLHSPLPMAGEFAASVATVAHTCWSGPAFETVGFC